MLPSTRGGRTTALRSPAVVSCWHPRADEWRCAGGMADSSSQTPHRRSRRANGRFACAVRRAYSPPTSRPWQAAHDLCRRQLRQAVRVGGYCWSVCRRECRRAASRCPASCAGAAPGATQVCCPAYFWFSFRFLTCMRKLLEVTGVGAGWGETWMIADAVPPAAPLQRQDPDPQREACRLQLAEAQGQG